MTNESEMITWLDEHIAMTSDEREAQLLRDMRRCVWSALQRREAEMREIAALRLVKEEAA